MIPINEEIRFETTNKCNYNCLICPRETLTRKRETMSYGMFKSLLDKILKETDQYKVCTFSGFGEPFLDPTFFKKIEYSRKKRLSVLMLTNASLLTLEKFKKLDKVGVTSVRVSFYGNTPKVYNKIHNVKKKDSFKKIRDCLTQISEIKERTKLIMTYNVEEGVNHKDMGAWIDYWKDKADLLEVWKPHNWVDGRNYRKIQVQKKKTCGRPWKTPLQVQVDGTINMCCFDYDGKLLLGDLKKQSLKEIFDSEMTNKIRKCHTTGKFKGSGLICENCDQRNVSKKGVMIYNSKFDIAERIKEVSTTYSSIETNEK